MFEQHFALRENPFVASHQSRFIYPSPEHQEAIAHLRYGIENREPFVLITGEVGTGKTTALFEVLGEWKSRAVVAVITNSALSRNELLEEIGLRLGFAAPPASTKPQLLAHLERHLLALRSQGEHAILLLDEAQNLDRELLEEIRLLSNLEAQGDKLLQVFLLGQPELEAKLMQPELRQLRQRVAVHYRLKPLSADDTQRYIHHRIAVAGGYGPRIFPQDACESVYELSHGIPREINQLCAQALLNAFVEDSDSVRPEHVRAAAHEIEFESVLRADVAAAAARPAAPSATTEAPPPARAAPEETQRAVEPPAEPAEAVEHMPAGPVVPATDEASWEAWVRSLMVSRPEPAATPGPDAEIAAHATGPAGAPPAAPAREPQAHEVPPAPSVVPDPVHVPEPGPAPSRIPEPVEVPEPDPDRSPSPEPERGPEPSPDPTRARVVPPEPARSPSIVPLPRPRAPREQPEPEPAGRGDADWRPPLWTPGASSRRRHGARVSGGALALEDEEPAGSSRALVWLAALGVVAALVVTGVLLVRFGVVERWLSRNTSALRSEAPPTSVAQRAAVPTPRATARDSQMHVAPPGAQEHAQVVSPAQPTTGPGTAPGTEGVAPSAGATSPAAPAPSATAPTTLEPSASAPHAAPAAGRTFSLVVGTFLDESRARGESQRLASSTGLPVRVRVIPQNAGTYYQLAVGRFDDRASAERAAGELIAKGVVNEARVIARRRAPVPAP